MSRLARLARAPASVWLDWERSCLPAPGPGLGASSVCSDKELNFMIASWKLLLSDLFPWEYLLLG